MFEWIAATLASALCLAAGSLYLKVPVTFATVAVSAATALIVGVLCSALRDRGEAGVACVRFTVRLVDGNTEKLRNHAAWIGIGLTALSHKRFAGRCTARRFAELHDALGIAAEFTDVVEFVF